MVGESGEVGRSAASLLTRRLAGRGVVRWEVRSHLKIYFHNWKISVDKQATACYYCLMATKHKSDCKMAFGRKDETCPRCVELLNGAAPIKWAVSNDVQRTQDVRNHFNSEKHRTGGCGVVCTFGEW